MQRTLVSDSAVFERLQIYVILEKSLVKKLDKTLTKIRAAALYWLGRRKLGNSKLQTTAFKPSRNGNDHRAYRTFIGLIQLSFATVLLVFSACGAALLFLVAQMRSRKIERNQKPLKFSKSRPNKNLSTWKVRLLTYFAGDFVYFVLFHSSEKIF